MVAQIQICGTYPVDWRKKYQIRRKNYEKNQFCAGIKNQFFQKNWHLEGRVVDVVVVRVVGLVACVGFGG